MHFSTFNLIAELGGEIAINYGLWLGERYRKPRSSAQTREVIAKLIDEKVKKIYEWKQKVSIQKLNTSIQKLITLFHFTHYFSRENK